MQQRTSRARQDRSNTSSVPAPPGNDTSNRRKAQDRATLLRIVAKLDSLLQRVAQWMADQKMDHSTEEDEKGVHDAMKMQPGTGAVAAEDVTSRSREWLSVPGLVELLNTKLATLDRRMRRILLAQGSGDQQRLVAEQQRQIRAQLRLVVKDTGAELPPTPAEEEFVTPAVFHRGQELQHDKAVEVEPFERKQDHDHTYQDERYGATTYRQAKNKLAAESTSPKATAAMLSYMMSASSRAREQVDPRLMSQILAAHGGGPPPPHDRTQPTSSATVQKTGSAGGGVPSGEQARGGDEQVDRTDVHLDSHQYQTTNSDSQRGRRPAVPPRSSGSTNHEYLPAQRLLNNPSESPPVVPGSCRAKSSSSPSGYVSVPLQPPPRGLQQKTLFKPAAPDVTVDAQGGGPSPTAGPASSGVFRSFALPEHLAYPSRQALPSVVSPALGNFTSSVAFVPPFFVGQGDEHQQERHSSIGHQQHHPGAVLSLTSPLQHQHQRPSSTPAASVLSGPLVDPPDPNVWLRMPTEEKVQNEALLDKIEEWLGSTGKNSTRRWNQSQLQKLADFAKGRDLTDPERIYKQYMEEKTRQAAATSYY
ncbi:unnamed protein product [Amoebophrya sp. A120]|nr:unnamed protein product [Amoebophrya sp. A120]|eukprot:GSA120T00003778001.1